MGAKSYTARAMPTSIQNPAATEVSWTENDTVRHAGWPDELLGNPPKRIVLADDTLDADTAFRLASQGTSILWRGDFQNARQLLQALGRRMDKRSKDGKQKAKTPEAPPAAADEFHRHRLRQSQRSDMLNRILIELDTEGSIALRRAPDVREALHAALPHLRGPSLLSLRALQGIIGAHEWRRKGVTVPGLAHPIHVHFGVFSPIRGEYIDLVMQAPLPSTELAFDIGTGSGVLAAVLAQRGVRKIIATDQDSRALACARENINGLGLAKQIELQQTDLFPAGTSPLIVCNPPWLPAKPTKAIEHALYDPGSEMLLGFLNGLDKHLAPEGEAWLIMSDLAEHLGLRSRDFLPEAFVRAGLQVLGKLEARPRHAKALDESDPLHAARRAETTSLWRLARVTARNIS